MSVDPLALHLGSLCVLLFGALLDSEVSLEVLVDFFLLVDCPLVVVNFVTLRNGLFCPLLVLAVDILLNDLNVY